MFTVSVEPPIGTITHSSCFHISCLCDSMPPSFLHFHKGPFYLSSVIYDFEAVPLRACVCVMYLCANTHFGFLSRIRIWKFVCVSQKVGLCQPRFRSGEEIKGTSIQQRWDKYSHVLLK